MLRLEYIDRGYRLREAARLESRTVGDVEQTSRRQIVLEAARAIYDVPIVPALTKLAERAKHTLKDVPDPVVLRILAANYRLGTIDNAQALVNVAVVTNSLPYTGVTLPLVSFGGSSTVISLVAIGLLLNISRQPMAAREVEAEREESPFEAPPPRPRPVPRTRVPKVERRRHARAQVSRV
jgi:hypothetical protein